MPDHRVQNRRLKRSLRALDALYATLPTLKCQGKCQESCGPIMMTPLEAIRLKDRVGPLHPVNFLRRDDVIIVHSPKLTCPLLDTQTGRCTVYEIRPTICRLWGLVKKMRCPFGCVPSRWLTDKEAGNVLRAARYRSDEVEKSL